MRKTDKEIKWHKLDNTANVFPVISNEELSSVYRIGVVLKEEVVPELLNQALNLVLPWFEGMNVRLRRGIFWYYFETNNKVPIIKEEQIYPCHYIDPNNSNKYLFRVTYYKTKINVEIFHALTDGYGAINFLKELTAQYLRLRYPTKFVARPQGPVEKTSFQVEDSYLKYYKKERAKGYRGVVAYKLKDTELQPGVMGVTHGFLNIPSLKEVCRGYEVSITQYLAAVLVYSIYKEYYLKKPDKHPIRINIPVNLRQFFPSQTTQNFFGVVFAQMNLEEGKDYSFEEIRKAVTKSFARQLTQEHMEKLISYNVSNEKNRFLRCMPLFVKNIGIGLVYKQSARAFSTTLSNLGLIQMLPEYEPFIENFHFIMCASSKQAFKCVAGSYGQDLILTFCSVWKDNRLQKAFFQQLREDGVQHRIEGNGVYEGEEPGKIPYPDKLKEKRPDVLWTKGYFGAAVYLGFRLIMENIDHYHGIPWSLVSTGAIIYFLLTMRFAVRQHTNPAAKIMVQTVASQLLCLLADVVLGNHGWALKYAIPALLILANGFQLILMVIHRSKWHNYLVFLIGYVVIAILLLILCFCGVTTRWKLTVIGAVISVGILLGSLLFDHKKAKTELKRRFRI